jgi:hypothetical protein
MEPNEIKHGNLVNWEQNIHVIIGITQEKIMTKFTDDDEDDAPYYHCYEHLKPILLTEEWLLKFGFEQGRNEWSKDGECFEWFSDGYYFTAGDGCKIGLVIKYVHQLQNIYFALTGEELTIK